jgi:nucleoside-diphosphate-sugar epimerase
MRILVTGAGGFIGRALVQRLLGTLGGLPVQGLVALDRQLPPLADARVQRIEGDLADPAVRRAALARPPALVFHLASVPGALAERDPALGRRVNLEGTIALFQALAAAAGGPPPRVVFASTVAVYGSLPDEPIDEDRPPQPTLSYGTHKLMMELLLADHSRRGELDAVSLRLPGVVARPAGAGGFGSAFMSELFQHLRARRAWTCPVGPDARCWWMSLRCCIDNLLHAAALDSARLPASRVVQLPVLTARVQEVVAAAASAGSIAVRYAPDAAIEHFFGRLPLLLTPRARALGFVDDGSLAALAERALSATAGA